MDSLAKDDLRTLLEVRPGRHVSVFMPTIQRGAETQQNPIRCKTLLRQAEAQLLACGLPPREAQDLLHPAQELLSDQPFWQRQRQGLALFLAPDMFRAYRVLLEYDGEQHRDDDAQFHRDVERLNDLAAAGWIVIRVGRRLPLARALDQLELALRARGWRGIRSP